MTIINNEQTNTETTSEVLTDVETQTNTLNSTNTNSDVETTNETNASPTLTEEQILKMIQSEADKVRTEYSKKLKDKEKEIEEVKKSSMSEQEKLDYENKSLQEQLDEREQSLREKEDAFNRSQLELSAIELLKDNSLPLDAKSFLIGTNIDTTTENINKFKVMFDTEVANAISERIKGTSKEHKETFVNSSMTKEQFDAMSYNDKCKLNAENPELYKTIKSVITV